MLVAFWARRLGARDVVVADLGRHQEQRAAAMGATGFALSGPGLDAEVQAMIGARPDIVFECVGKKGLIDFACRLVRVHGTVVGVGLCVGGDEWDPFAALSKEIQVVFAVFFTMAEFETAIEALGPGRFSPRALITDRIGFGAGSRNLRGAAAPYHAMQGADPGRRRLIGDPGRTGWNSKRKPWTSTVSAPW